LVRSNLLKDANSGVLGNGFAKEVDEAVARVAEKLNPPVQPRGGRRRIECRMTGSKRPHRGAAANQQCNQEQAASCYPSGSCHTGQV